MLPMQLPSGKCLWGTAAFPHPIRSNDVRACIWSALSRYCRDPLCLSSSSSSRSNRSNNKHRRNGTLTTVSHSLLAPLLQSAALIVLSCPLPCHGRIGAWLARFHRSVRPSVCPCPPASIRCVGASQCLSTFLILSLFCLPPFEVLFSVQVSVLPAKTSPLGSNTAGLHSVQSPFSGVALALNSAVGLSRYSTLRV